MKVLKIIKYPSVIYEIRHLILYYPFILHLILYYPFIKESQKNIEKITYMPITSKEQQSLGRPPYPKEVTEDPGRVAAT